MRDVTRTGSVLYGTGSRRYEPGAQWLHWLTAALIFVIVPLGLAFGEFKTVGGKPPTGFDGPFPGTPFAYATVHKTLGLIVFALVVARLAFRIANPPPAMPGRMGGAMRVLSHGSHWLLYALLIVMPVSGYIMSSSGKNPISILWLFDFPKLPISQDTGKVAQKVHLFAQWALYALVLLHLAATAWHAFVRRDAILDRMLPRQANAE